jgi:hypothetical protein
MGEPDGGFEIKSYEDKKSIAICTLFQNFLKEPPRQNE